MPLPDSKTCQHEWKHYGPQIVSCRKCLITDHLVHALMSDGPSGYWTHCRKKYDIWYPDEIVRWRTHTTCPDCLKALDERLAEAQAMSAASTSMDHIVCRNTKKDDEYECRILQAAFDMDIVPQIFKWAVNEFFVSRGPKGRLILTNIPDDGKGHGTSFGEIIYIQPSFDETISNVLKAWEQYKRFRTMVASPPDHFLIKIMPQMQRGITWHWRGTDGMLWSVDGIEGAYKCLDVWTDEQYKARVGWALVDPENLIVGVVDPNKVFTLSRSGIELYGQQLMRIHDQKVSERVTERVQKGLWQALQKGTDPTVEAKMEEVWKRFQAEVNMIMRSNYAQG